MTTSIPEQGIIAALKAQLPLTGPAVPCARQDAAILNIQRACDAALDMGQHLIRRERLGVGRAEGWAGFFAHG